MGRGGQENILYSNQPLNLEPEQSFKIPPKIQLVDMEAGNTEIYYLYRDANNYKTTHEVVVEGKITDAGENELRDCLDNGEGFIPEQVGLAPLQESLAALDGEDEYDEDNNPDHAWHELVAIKTTTEEHTEAMDMNELLAAFQDAKDNWDENLSAF